MDLKTLIILSPELILVLGILLALLLSICPRNKGQMELFVIWVLIFATLASSLMLFPASPQELLSGAFIYDSLSSFFRFLIYLISTFVAIASKNYLSVLESPKEYFPILLTATLGAACLTASGDMLTTFVSLETLGLSAILLASYARLNQKSNEAGIKYLISSSVSTATLLLGFSFLYGISSLTNFAKISTALTTVQSNSSALLSPLVISLIIVCILAVIAFKLGAAPFHNWSPDVYAGAPTTTTLFLAVVSKLAVFGFAIRFLGLFNQVFSTNVVLLTALVAIASLSIIIGNYVGVIQMIQRSSVKRLLAYSSIAQAGYLLIGLCVFDFRSLVSAVLYLIVYSLMNTLVFLGLIYFESATGSDKISDYAGLLTKKPFLAIAMVLALVNLAGLPFIPAAFIAKFFLFSSAFASGTALMKALALIGLLGSVVALYYYLYFAKIIIVDSPSDAVKEIKVGEFSLIEKLSVFVLILLVLLGVCGMQLGFIFANQVIAGLM